MPLSALAIGGGPVCAESALGHGACVGDGCVSGHVGGRPFAKCLPSASAGPVCTYDVVEAVAVCVGPGPCATVFLGPSATTRCVPGEVCTTGLVESVGACVGNGCVVVYVGPSATPVCIAVAAPPRCLPGELACWSVRDGTACVTYRTGDLEDPREACVGPVALA